MRQHTPLRFLHGDGSSDRATKYLDCLEPDSVPARARSDREGLLTRQGEHKLNNGARHSHASAAAIVGA